MMVFGAVLHVLRPPPSHTKIASKPSTPSQENVDVRKVAAKTFHVSLGLWMCPCLGVVAHGLGVAVHFCDVLNVELTLFLSRCKQDGQLKKAVSGQWQGQARSTLFLSRFTTAGQIPKLTSRDTHLLEGAERYILRTNAEHCQLQKHFLWTTVEQNSPNPLLSTFTSAPLQHRRSSQTRGSTQKHFLEILEAQTHRITSLVDVHNGRKVLKTMR